MSDATALFVIFLLVGVILFVVGLPLMLRLIAPNGYYGYRTPRTLADATVWYPVNRALGAWFLAAGLLTQLVAGAVYALQLNMQSALMVNTACVLVGVAAGIVHSTVLLFRAPHARA